MDLQGIVNFVARVKQKNPSIFVQGLGLNKSRSGRSSGGDTWDATVSFHFYQNEDVRKSLGKKPPRPKPAAPSDGSSPVSVQPK